jgi:manganese efflux pump family protein
MNYFVIVLTATGLAMDAFAVAVASGGCVTKGRRLEQALRVGLSFGLFQMIMPLAGWALGSSLKQYISALDHWVAFIILAAIGVKMIYEAFLKEEGDQIAGPMTNRRLLFLSIATSIDALAVGIGFAFLDYPVVLVAALIGGITFLISAAGIFIGHFCNAIWGKRAELAGGLLLILIGIKILSDHLR